MTKAHTTISVDVNVLQKAKAMNLNLSGEFQKLLEKLILSYENNIDGINEELLDSKIGNLRNNYIKIDAELQSAIRLKEQRIELRKKVEEQELLERKQLMEAATKCLKCHKILTPEHKIFSFSKGIVCKSCFLGASATDFKTWKGEQNGLPTA